MSEEQKFKYLVKDENEKSIKKTMTNIGSNGKPNNSKKIFESRKSDAGGTPTLKKSTTKNKNEIDIKQKERTSKLEVNNNIIKKINFTPKNISSNI